MSRVYAHRKYAPGYARRSFKGGVYRQEQDPVTGEVKKVRVPASYWQQPEECVALDALPEFWEHNNTQFTSEWRRAFNDRLISDYLDIVFASDPEVSSASNATYGELVRQKEAFFDAVTTIDKWPFWKYTVQKQFREGSLVSDRFHEACPEYSDYLAYKSTRNRPFSERQGVEYADWRRTCLDLDKKGVSPYQISGTENYEYRDEELQLGEIELSYEIEVPENIRHGLYEYFSGLDLVPGLREVDWDDIYDKVTEILGKNVSIESFEQAVIEHVDRQREIAAVQSREASDDRHDNRVVKPGAAEPRKSVRELQMKDLDRLVADLYRSSSGKERGVGGYGW